MGPTDELTNDFPIVAGEDAAGAKGSKTTLVPAAVPRPTTDLQSLLHKRLRFLGLLLTGGTAVLVAFCLVQMLLGSSRTPWDGWLYLIIYLITFAVAATCTGLLWIRRSLSLGPLRMVELVLFGVLYAFWAWTHTSIYPQLRLASPPIWFGSIMANAVCLPYAIMMTTYGIFIPNTWHRCAAVVGLMGVTPLVIGITSGLAAEATDGNFVGYYFVPVAVWMLVASAVAIYGSHRIELLRKEVVAARRLGQYQLKQRLGVGGMGEVYLAEHVLLRRPCAVKLIRQDAHGDSSSLSRFEREVRVTATLTHPNTVQVFDYGRADDGTFYYAMEYLPGLNLEELVKQHGPLPPERVVHLLRQVCGALAEAHAAGLVHRDIKPSNIISSARGGLYDVAKLLDFGLVRRHGLVGRSGTLTQEGTFAGTPDYMSPEQANGEKDLDRRSDIYSLGATAYFLLTGQPAFVRSTPLQTLIAHLHDPLIPLDRVRSDVPADLQAVVERCLEKNPAERWPDARSVDKALAGCSSASLWTEERAAAWWHEQARSAKAID